MEFISICRENKFFRHAAGLAILLFLMIPPVFLHLFPDLDNPFPRPQHRIISGDEVQYYLMLLSLVRDGDLDLNNNYSDDDIRNDKRLDLRSHHTWAVDPKTREVYPYNAKHMHQIVTGLREYSFHGFGTPVLAFVLVKLLFLPPDVALRFLSCIMVLITLLVFYKILVLKNISHPYIKSLLLLVATPLWHYSGSMDAAPALAGLLMLAVYFTAFRPRPVIAALVIVAGTLVKIPFAALALPAAYWLYRDMNKKGLFQLFVPLFVAAVLHAFLNMHWFGNAFFVNQTHTYAPPLLDNPIGIVRRMLAYLWGSRHGLFIFTPFLMFLFRPVVARGMSKDPLFHYTLIWFVSVSIFREIHTGTCYGPRHLVPVIALLTLPVLADMTFWEKRPVRLLFVGLLALSVAINLQSILLNSNVYTVPPWHFIVKHIL